ncbi:MAG: 4Fe-4S single cluster domain-containing protein [Chloroflexota bacterium]
MARELLILVDATTGDLLVEGPDRLPRHLTDALEGLLGPSQTIACAAPADVRLPEPASASELVSTDCVRIAGLWHGSLIEGPGRRTVVKLQGCPVRCVGCITPETWDPNGGVVVPVDRLAIELLDSGHPRDGVTLLGGEPFAQPDGLLALVVALRSGGCRHILCYSGYTYEALRRQAEWQPAIRAVMDEIDMLIDGPYVAALAEGAGPWTGSANQRVLDLKSPPAHGSTNCAPLATDHGAPRLQ